MKDFAREAFVRQGYAVDIAIHAPDKMSDSRNHHAHLMITMRTLGPQGFAAKKDRNLNSKEQLGAWREQWAYLVNRHLERHGHEARIDHRSLQARGVDQEPTVHLGYAANEIAQRGGQSDRMDALRRVIERNEIRFEMTAIDRELKALENTAGKGGPAEKGALQVVDAATDVASKLGDFMVDLLAGPSPAQDRPADMKAFVSDPAARKEQQLARLAANRQAQAADKALERMDDDMQAGRALKSDDIKNLTRAQQETIRSHGDDGVRQMVEDAQKRAERHWKGESRDRERD